MNKNIILLIFIFSISFISCKTSKSGIITSKEKAKEKGIYSYNEKNNNSKNSTTSKSYKKRNSHKTKVNIVETAKEYLGVKYKSSGTTKAGMDCSGLVYTSFLAYDIELSISSDMAKEGREISTSKAEEGDLIFFKTNNSKTINHVGIITENYKGEIKFIHSSTSKGVIISSLNESYYTKAFEKIKRIIE